MGAGWAYGSVCVNREERANEEVWVCGRKVEFKEGKRDKEEGRQEKGGTEGYLRDISHNVGEEKTVRRVDGETSSQGEDKEEGEMELRNIARKNMSSAQV